MRSDYRVAFLGFLVLFCLVMLALSTPQEIDGDAGVEIPPESSLRIGVVGLEPGLGPEILHGRIESPFTEVRKGLEQLQHMGFIFRRMFSRPLHELEAERAAAIAAGLDAAPPDLGRWLIFEVPDGSTMAESLALLRALPFVDSAYAMPKAYPASLGSTTFPNFKQMQGYIDEAPGGMEVKYVWKLPGGKSQEIRIADVEGDWNVSHNDLKGAKSKNVDGRLLGGIWYNHGTAVLGELMGTRNSYGVTGIAFRSKILMFSIGRTDSQGKNYTDVPDAINRAAAQLRPGDVILLEVQYSGLKQSGDYIPVEYYDADFDAIRAATAKGIVVVEAAGNGGQNLDSSLYKNRFDRKKRGDSQAIIVGAGASPGGYQQDRSRLYFSNYGSRLDVQGWGESVTTTGYGDLYKEGGKNNYYTSSFNGTSSASGMVAGAMAALQGVAKKALGDPLKPKKLRKIVVKTGSPQQGGKAKKIGPRPNLKKAAEKILAMAEASDE